VRIWSVKFYSQSRINEAVSGIFIDVTEHLFLFSHGTQSWPLPSVFVSIETRSQCFYLIWRNSETKQMCNSMYERIVRSCRRRCWRLLCLIGADDLQASAISYVLALALFALLAAFRRPLPCHQCVLVRDGTDRWSTVFWALRLGWMDGPLTIFKMFEYHASPRSANTQ